MSPARRKGYVLKYRVPPRAAGETADGPYAIAERIGRYSAGWRWPIALATTVGIHAGLTFLAYLGDREHREIAPAPQQVVTLERPPPPPPEPPPPPLPRPPPRRTAAPAAAQSGRVLTAAPDPAEPVDLTKFAMPVGKSESYAGGLTAATGTATVAVTDPRASARGVGGGSQARPAAPARRDWACAWPEEEQSSDLHDTRVTIRVKVSETGRAEEVEVLNGPKDSFIQAARACARGETFRPARNDAGQEVTGLTSPFAVHFVR
jgi:protein TonB